MSHVTFDDKCTVQISGVNKPHNILNLNLRFLSVKTCSVFWVHTYMHGLCDIINI